MILDSGWVYKFGNSRHNIIPTVPRTPHAAIWGAWHASGVKTVHPVTSYGGIIKTNFFMVHQGRKCHSAMLHHILSSALWRTVKCTAFQPHDWFLVITLTTYKDILDWKSLLWPKSRCMSVPYMCLFLLFGGALGPWSRSISSLDHSFYITVSGQMHIVPVTWEWLY